MTHSEPGDARKTNHLAGQTSPYLLQHLHNPVDWHPWEPAALDRARGEGKPIFLSIGYAACHWCHVMERESFEDESIAAFMNEHFIPIKVDREERPDLDEIYMSAVQLMTGSGGWPLSVFLTPELKPFFGGTYFPPDERFGRPGFLMVLRSVAAAWESRRADIETSAEELTSQIRAIGRAPRPPNEEEPLGLAEIARAAAELSARFDSRWGGFGPAPKFPPHGALGVLLREHARSGEASSLRMVETTLDRMALGGMYDQIGGGFARYSTDERWLVPHFEKMLTDQALLAPAYADAWLLTRKPLYRRIVERTLDFVLREMTVPEGGFTSSLDADSEGHEGRFYIWSPEEVSEALGPQDGAFYSRIYGIVPGGNFEGKSIPNLLGGSLAEQAGLLGTTEQELVSRLEPMGAALLASRERRVRPATDDKVLTAWNGLMISAFARGYQAFGRSEDLRAARRAAEFVLGHLLVDGRLLVSYRAGRPRLNAYLDDHAFLARGLLDLYEAGFDRGHLEASARIARSMAARFADRDGGGFFFTSEDHETLLARTRSLHDGALPSGAGVAAETLLRLATHLDDAELRGTAVQALTAYRRAVERAPAAFASLLAAADFAEGPVHEIAIVGSHEDLPTRLLLQEAWRRYLPNRIIELAQPGERVDGLPLLAGKTAIGGAATAYVCRGTACQAPTTEPEALARALAPSRS